MTLIIIYHLYYFRGISYRQDGIVHTYPLEAYLDRDSGRMAALVDYTYVQVVAAKFFFIQIRKFYKLCRAKFDKCVALLGENNWISLVRLESTSHTHSDTLTCC